MPNTSHMTDEERRELIWFSDSQGQTDPKQLAGKPQIWKVGGRYFVAYNIPRTQTPLVWEATEAEIKERYGGIDSPMPPIDRQMSEQDFATLSPWLGGRISEIRLTTDDPWSQFYADYRESAELRPWLNDPDMMATIATAYLEGRTPTADELSQTKWWKRHTAAEREWLETSVTLGPEEIRRQASDRTRQIQTMLREAGANNVPKHVAAWMAGQHLSGRWGDEYLTEQIRKLADPYAPGELNGGIIQRLRDKGVDINQTRAEEDTVRDMATRWLGPTMGSMGQNEIERWAGRIRNDPDAAMELEQHLKMVRKGLFPGHENENLTYEDIVAPVRNLATSIWGRPVMDNEAMLVDLANLGDYTEMQKRLRKTGLDQGIEKVVTDALDELGNSALGQQVVRSAI